MSTRRTFARSAAVLGAATALTVAGAGAAMATTHTSDVDGNDVSVTFELGDGLLDLGDTCGAVLTPTAAAAGLATQLADGNITNIFDTLVNDDNVTVLYRDGLILDTPLTVLSQIDPTRTVTATDVPSNVYALVSICLSEPTSPEVNPAVIVGDPMEAIMGSVEMGSSNGGLDTASAILQGGGLDTASALLGGEGELDGGMLGLLSGSADEGETED